ncbi:hypothetical protein BZM27_42050 [Paraburkholderia steynii]|uniref:Uncharacterized protein n=1 Tax=Paraburkholderia steynii TaxID=1245441 RepID=A0A4R0X722_9BURK|nr:hypothetical protein BZM27_42050 [Paraburkholderia steynii]
MNTMKLATSFAAVAAFATLAGCVTSEQQISAAPARPRPQPAVVAVQAPPPPPPAIVLREPAQPVYVSAPSDVYIAGVIDRDVVFVGGSTYLWVVGPDGKRHRHFYARGDRRAEVFRRREHLRVEMAHRGGHPPVHAAMPPRRDEHRAHSHGERSAYVREPHRSDRHDGAPVRHAEHRPQAGSARVAGQSGHDVGQREHNHPPHVDEAQQPVHRQGHAG